MNRVKPSFSGPGKYLAVMVPVAAAVLFLAGCQGSSNSTSSAPAPAGNTRAVVSMGPVSQVGTGNSGQSTLTVNGSTYVVNNSTQVTVNGQASTIGSVNAGDIVTVRTGAASGSTSGTAESVDAESEIEGPITAINVTGSASGTITILGQTITIDSATLFDGKITGQSINGLSVNQAVEVSGVLQAGGGLLATRIDPGSANEYQVTGVVGNENAGASTFDIGTLTVNYGSATDIQGFGSGGPQNGEIVKATGTSLDSTGALTALGIFNLSHSVSSDTHGGDDGSIYGAVSNFVSATDFEVAGQAVTTTSSTSYENGTASDLADNVVVEVEGQINASGVLVARQIQFQAQPEVDISAPVDSVDATQGTIAVLGVTVQVDSSTRMSDDSSADARNFTLTNLQPGDYVDVSATANSSGTLVATTLQRENSQSSDEISAPVQTLANPDFTLAGIQVITNSSTRFVGVSATTFFSSALGKRADVTGIMNGSAFIATSVGFDD